MALTDVRKSQEAVYVRCTVKGFEDEEHALLPYTKEMARSVGNLSQSRELRAGQLVREFDVNLFDEGYIRLIWKGWRGIRDPQDETGQRRLDGPGIVHASGEIESPAAFNEKNKAILLNSRPMEFFEWMQDAANELAKAAHQQVTNERETFRQADAVPARQPEAEV